MASLQSWHSDHIVCDEKVYRVETGWLADLVGVDVITFEDDAKKPCSIVERSNESG